MVTNKKVWANTSRVKLDVQNALKNSDGEFIVFDLETTGLSRTDDRIIELAAKKYLIEIGRASCRERV